MVWQWNCREVQSRKVSYLSQAHKWAKARTKSFSPIRAIPSLIAVSAQYFLFCLSTMSNILITTATLVGSYVFLYVMEYLWKLFFLAPAQITAGMQSQIDSLSTENTVLKTRPEGPEILLEYTDRPIIRGQLSLHNVAGGTARNIYLGEMKTRSLSCAPSSNVPFLNIGENKHLDLRIVCTDPGVSGGFTTDQFLMEAADEPILAAIYHEDANGKKFSTEFEIRFDSKTFKPIISQQRRQLVSGA
jgi:hypothetical protein